MNTPAELRRNKSATARERGYRGCPASVSKRRRRQPRAHRWPRLRHVNTDDTGAGTKMPSARVMTLSLSLPLSHLYDPLVGAFSSNNCWASPPSTLALRENVLAGGGERRPTPHFHFSLRSRRAPMRSSSEARLFVSSYYRSDDASSMQTRRRERPTTCGGWVHFRAAPTRHR